MCSGPNSTRARNFLTITRQVFWLIPIARLGAFPQVQTCSDRKFRVISEFGKRYVLGKIQQRVLPRILTCVPFSASSGTVAHAGHHIITAQNYKLFPDSPNKSYLGQKRKFFLMNDMQHLVELSGKKKCARGNRCRDLKATDAGGRCDERS